MKRLLSIVATGLLAVTAAHAQVAAKPQVPPSKRIVLLVDEIKQIRSFPIVIAERLGYLNDDGYAVTVMNIRDDVSKDELLMDGRVDAIMAYYHHNVVNQSQGRSTEAIVTLGVTPGMKVMVANQAKDKIRSPADLKGSRIIAGGAGSSKTTTANMLVLAGGYQLGDYTRIANESKDKIAMAVRNGEADLVIAPTPDGSYYEAQGVATTWADLTTPEGTKQYFGTLFPSNTIYMSTERVRTNPEIARHLAKAFVRTLEFINTHTPEEIAAVVPVEVSGKDKAAYLKVLKEQIPMFRNDGRMPADGAEKEWRVLSEFNPKYKPVKVADTYTNRFVDEALQVVGKRAP
jgi:NitT/TauT family transport system substrate-binding protein